MAVGSKQNLVSFGSFEVNIDVGEVRRSGMRVRLAGQPFRLLVTLLARPGEIVTREELQREIWGANTNVDFERGIASAVNKLREALGDSAEHPRYVETLARRGYRFIAPVRVNDDARPEEKPSLEELQLPGGSDLVSPFTKSPVLPELLPADLPPGVSLDAEGKSPVFLTPELLKGLVLGCLIAGALLLLVLVLILVLGLLPVLPAIRGGTQGSTPPPEIEQLTQSTNIYPGPPNPETFLSISTDGPRLYVPVLADGKSQISSLTLNGTEPQPVKMPEDLSSGAISDISHDGSKLLVRSLQTRAPEQPLWIVPTGGSGALRVGDILAHDATWMPGDESVLFASANDLEVIRLSDGAVSPYVSLPGRAFWLRWSPDGSKLRFTLLEPTNHRSSLWELDGATRRIRRLPLSVGSESDLCCGSWTPSGDAFTFQSDDAHRSDVWVIGNRAHAQPQQLTNGPLRFTSPVPSRESRVIYVFGAAQPGGTQIYDSGLHRFVAAPSFLRNAQRLSFSRDGAWVAWTDPQQRLWRAHSKDGADLLQLSGSDLEVFSASWSPDGSQLLLMARQPGKPWQIFTESASGGTIHLVLADGKNLADPQWSPDGTEIVFGREADLMGKETGPHDIRMMNLRTHEIQPLPDSQDLFSPRWSPDGLWIAALSRDQTRLLVYNVKERTWKTLFSGGAADPVWSPDSEFIFFHAFAQPNPAILCIGVKGDTVRTVADLSKLGATAAQTYFFSGISPDSSPFVEVRVGTGNLYSIALPPAKD